MRITMKCAKKQKILCRRDFPLADFSRNEQVIEAIFIDQFNQLGRKYRYLESAVEKCNARIANLNKTVASLKSTVANHLCLLEEKDLTISTQLSTISTQATTILDTELFKQLLEFTITSQEQSISELKLTKLQLEENARFNFGHLLPDGLQCGEQLHLPCQNSLQLGTLPEYPQGGLNMSTSPSSNSDIIPCVLPGLGLNGDDQGNLLHVGEADDLLYEGEVLLLVSTEGSKSGVSLPCYTPASTTNSPPVNHQQIYPKTEKDEMKPSQSALMRNIDKASISHLAKVVDDLSTKYCNTNLSKSTKPGKRPSIVPKVFQAIWKLLLAPHTTVSDPTPDVDWSQVRFKPPLPDPVLQPVLSAPQDPKFYSSSGSKPFGSIPGYMTTMGVVPVPSKPVGGYIYCLETKMWLIHATSASTSRGPWRTARRVRPGETGGRRRR